MHRIIINLFVALLTFALGIVASLLFNGVISSSAERACKSSVVVSQAPPPKIVSEPISGRCGCRQDEDKTLSTEEASQSRAPIIGGILNGKAISLPNPPYPPIAKAARASGNVAVEILIDERGCVQSARAVGGHPLLQSAATEAAREACFSPTRLSGQPVKVKGVLTYNFVLR
ncbi:MAG TPA: energy transducer TonB [Pyrinomonadaceae bacterium]